MENTRGFDGTMILWRSTGNLTHFQNLVIQMAACILCNETKPNETKQIFKEVGLKSLKKINVTIVIYSMYKLSPFRNWCFNIPLIPL